ncbi:phosphoglycerate kinase [Geodermatophilus obscurus]|uniref:Phosphoglycerate kinase n=1 Tax=Geodermatophilus obscurus (strain ATCC 25078 / DSM 43160 / JCM 3152 / CCUG 61914 / KCC A-0152 / KCTC 9177 / NBRC 13315 / NRRL B-3577 / G-20) TaxID=526225 RepID=D2SF45_GEOOG|nr:phosphoglycerate kinase [Geodermatophilus obscurus]ADB74735.1 Phosphoglycerate kinase [Geodermatophilus obscurus DSM 43160]
MRSLDDLLAEGVSGRRVLVRADLNVPLDKTTRAITDDGRIRASLPTLQALREAGARVVVAAHLGRPKGAPDPQYSLAPVAARLGELLGTEVPLAADVAGEDAQAKAGQLGDGDVVLLENVRFEAAETSKDDAERGGLADRFAALADTFVDDAFGAVHRKHASVYDVALRLPHVAGRLVATELDVLTRLTRDPERPYVVVLGGSKVSDKLAVIEALLPKVDRLLVGGGMCFTFLAAQGHGVGKSLLEADQVETCRRLLAEAGDRIVLPLDVVCAPEFSADVETTTVPVESIPDDQMGLDVGPRTVEAFGRELGGARTVFWNGPMGVFELAPFQAGTRGVAGAVAAVDGLSVVGGGDSAAAVRQLGLDEAAYGHISTGGGASLEYLEGRELPGLAVLAD